jgi:protein-L-isoaspartate(D-aspartate) O-methyltransferase
LSHRRAAVYSYRVSTAALIVALSLLAGACAPAVARDAADDRRAMIETIKAHAPQGPAPISERTLGAMAAVAREEFVPIELRAQAYRDTPLPIGHGQTISQPYVVALMTELAGVDADEVVLEVGTGSGYQAAVLAKLARKVFTIEIVEPLGRGAEQTLRRLGYANVEVRIGDGYAGWREHAPFDAIVVTAAPEEVPPPLLDQLAPGGRLVIPVGGSAFDQQLTVIEKAADATIAKREVLPVRFVPLTRDR